MVKQMENQTGEKFYIVVNEGGDLTVLEISEHEYVELTNIEVMLCDGLISPDTKQQVLRDGLRHLSEKTRRSDLVIYYEID